MKNLVSFASWPFQGGVQADTTLESGGVIVIRFTWSPFFPLKNAINNFSLITERRNELWKSTCFEAFIKPTNSANYFEINLSPQNFWNAYAFEEYRMPSPPREASNWTLLELRSNSGELTAKIKTDLNKNYYQIGLSCILESIDGQKSYWALKHCQSHPDFHNAESFQLERELK